MSIDELIEGCLKAKRDCQEHLYRRYAAKMFGVCMSYSRNRDMASDILHDGFIRVFTQFKNYDKKEDLEKWIRKTMIATAIDHLKKSKLFRFNELDTKAIEKEVRSELPEERRERELGWLIDKLPLGAKTIFNLYTLEGYNHREIADMLGINEKMSERQLSKARKVIQSLVSQYYGG